MNECFEGDAEITKMTTKLSSFHRFLLRARVYCAECVAPIRARQVVRDRNGHDICVCDFHAGNQEPESNVGEPQNNNWYTPKRTTTNTKG